MWSQSLIVASERALCGTIHGIAAHKLFALSNYVSNFTWHMAMLFQSYEKSTCAGLGFATMNESTATWFESVYTYTSDQALQQFA